MSAQYLEHVPVAEKSRNGDMATFIEDTPFGRIDLKSRPIGDKVCESEIVHTPLDPFAELTAHLAEAGPAQLELRQRPLQEGGTIRIVHQVPSSRSLAVITRRCGRGL